MRLLQLKKPRERRRKRRNRINDEVPKDAAASEKASIMLMSAAAVEVWEAASMCATLAVPIINIIKRAKKQRSEWKEENCARPLELLWSSKS